MQTVDLLTPIVDDPRTFGRIAAVNALSDVFAMGGRPITALNVVCFPVEAMGLGPLRAMIEGGLEAVTEAGALLIGGHSVKDEEPKYGLAVTGVVHPAEMMTNDGLAPGLELILTKPIGTGVISGANKRALATAEQVEGMVAVMTALNREAAELARAAGVRAATDVTGFGLAGHLCEMARSSRRSLRLFASEVPLITGALEHARAGRFPGGSKKNRQFFSRWAAVEEGVEEALAGLMFDAQTSGGLILGVAPERARELLGRLLDSGHQAALIGEVLDEPSEGSVSIVAER